MAVQGMSAEQLLESLERATGTYTPFQGRNAFAVGGNQQEFLQTFRNSTDPKTEQSTTILQSLTMMNGPFVTRATDPRNSATLAAVIDYPLFDTAGRIEALYLASLSRKPTAEELEKLVAYVESGGPQKDSARALGDVFWALLNSSEFKLIH
jgi:hypothetical protein